MQEPEKEGPSGLLVDLVRGVASAPRWILRRLRGEKDEVPEGVPARAIATSTHATLTICAVAVILSIGGWTKPGLEPFVLDQRAFSSEPWRLLSAHFVHVNLIHLWFNLTWIWFLGREIEQRLGAAMLLATSGFILLGTSAAVQAFDRGGIGLSGLVYGMWAMLFVAQRNSATLSGILNAKVNRLMVIWFFFCILTTMIGVFPVSNWGHGAGAVLGALVGLGFGPSGRMRPASLPLGSMLLALLAAGATVWYPAWNFGGASPELAIEGDRAFDRSDWKAAERAYGQAAHCDPSNQRAWWNLGCALSKQGREADAVEAFDEASRHGSLDSDQKSVLHALLLMQMNLRLMHDDDAGVLAFGKRAVRIEPSDRGTWAEIERAASQVHDAEWQQRARTAIAKLDEKR